MDGIQVAELARSSSVLSIIYVHPWVVTGDDAGLLCFWSKHTFFIFLKSPGPDTQTLEHIVDTEMRKSIRALALAGTDIWSVCQTSSVTVCTFSKN